MFENADNFDNSHKTVDNSDCASYIINFVGFQILSYMLTDIIASVFRKRNRADSNNYWVISLWVAVYYTFSKMINGKFQLKVIICLLYTSRCV